MCAVAGSVGASAAEDSSEVALGDTGLTLEGGVVVDTLPSSFTFMRFLTQGKNHNEMYKKARHVYKSRLGNSPNHQQPAQASYAQTEC